MSAVVVAAFIAAAATACTASEPTAPTASAPDFAGVLPPKADPLLAYGQSGTASVALARAEDMLTTKCMTAFGFTDNRTQDYKALQESFEVDAARLYGITDAKVAAINGYLPIMSDEGRSQAEDSQRSDPSYQLVRTGTRENQPPTESAMAESPGSLGGKAIPAGGCLGDARTQITGNPTGNPPESAQLGEKLRVQAWFDAWDDPRTVSAKAEWAACMKKSGYIRRDPVNDDLGFDSRDSNQAPEAEIQQALADIKCKQETDFVKRANEVHVEYAERAIEENQTALDESKSFYDALLKRANEIIAAG